MIDRRAVSRYARALFGLARTAKQTEQTDLQLSTACDLTERYSEIKHLISNSTISTVEKEDFITKILPAGSSPLVLDFIKVLIRKKRFDELPAIREAFHRLYEKEQGVSEVEVVTAVEISSENETSLRLALERKLKAKIRLIKSLDPGMIGGMILRFEGKEINSSYRSRLDDLKQRLMA